MLCQKRLSQSELLQLCLDFPLKLLAVYNIWSALSRLQMDVVDALLAFRIFIVQALVMLINLLLELDCLCH